MAAAVTLTGHFVSTSGQYIWIRITSPLRSPGGLILTNPLTIAYCNGAQRPEDVVLRALKRPHWVLRHPEPQAICPSCSSRYGVVRKPPRACIQILGFFWADGALDPQFQDLNR